jgi:hypothetical protein
MVMMFGIRCLMRAFDCGAQAVKKMRRGEACRAGYA